MKRAPREITSEDRCALCEQPSVGNNTLRFRDLGMTVQVMHRYACPGGMVPIDLGPGND